jgi:CHAD domain-containing protein
VTRPAEPSAGRPSSALEREIKLEATDGFRLPDLSGLPDVGQVQRLPDQTLTATYVDTSQLHLARHGLTLRHRTEVEGGTRRGIWTLKLPENADGVVFTRQELTWRGSRDRTPAEAVRLVRATTLGAPLRPVARLDTERRRLELLGPDGGSLGEVDDDRVSIRSGEHKGARFREIEVELAPAAPDALAGTVVERLRAAGASAGSSHPKLFRALGPAAQEPPDVVARALGRDASAREMVVASLARALGALTAHEPGIRLGGDVEHVHKARVATRRLRSDLRTFRPILDRAWVDRIRAELKWAASALGDARDADVLSGRLQGQARSLGLDGDPGTAALLAQLRDQRGTAQARLLKVLDSDRYLELLTSLRDAALDPALVGEADGGPARSVVPPLVARAWKRLRKEVRAFGKNPSDPALHEVRKRAKALRYAAEAASAVAGKPAKKLAARAEAVQDVLGALQDAVEARTWLDEHSRGGGAEQALVAGRLIERQRVARSQSRSRWPRAWKKLSNPKLRTWLTVS